MPQIKLRRVSDMPLNSQNQRVISGSNWDVNADVVEGAINGGLDTQNLVANANIKGSQLADNTLSRAKAAIDFERSSRSFWIDL